MSNFLLLVLGAAIGSVSSVLAGAAIEILRVAWSPQRRDKIIAGMKSGHIFAAVERYMRQVPSANDSTGPHHVVL